MTDSGQKVVDSSGHSEQNQQTGQCEVLTDSGQTVEDSSRHSDTEPRDGRK
jgi:hypothetical protein